jgi:hypothetical protein
MNSPKVRPRGQSANIFINYRREDSAGHAGRLFDGLSNHFAGRLFMDVDTLEPGIDFVEAIEQAVGSCEVLIVVIGREWLTVKDAAGNRRLDNPADFVRLEVESALARKIRVIPVLVQDAPMPRAEELPPSLARLARRNAIELSDARWAYDVDRLAHTIQEILQEKEAVAPPAAAPAVAAKAAGSRAWLLSLAALVLVAAVVLGSVGWIRRSPSGKEPAGNVVPAGNRVDTPPAANRAAAAEPAAPTVNLVDTPPAASRVEAAPSKGPAISPRATNPVSRQAAKEPAGSEPARPARRPEPPITNRVSDEPARSPAKEPAGSEPIRRAEPEESSEPAKSPAMPEISPRAANPASVAALQPPRVTITSPRNGEKVGQSVVVQGAVSGLDGQRMFLCIKHQDGAIYPRGEVFPKADGQWSIQLRSAKTDFQTFVVISSSQEAAQVLGEQTSRDHGLRSLPAGASIGSPVVALDRQGKILDILKRGGKPKSDATRSLQQKQ